MLRSLGHGIGFLASDYFGYTEQEGLTFEKDNFCEICTSFCCTAVLIDSGAIVAYTKGLRLMELDACWVLIRELFCERSIGG